MFKTKYKLTINSRDKRVIDAIHECLQTAGFKTTLIPNTRIRGYAAWALLLLSIAIFLVMSCYISVLRETSRGHQRKMEAWMRLIQNSPTAYAMCDESDEILLWSDGAEKCFGWKASDLVGATLEKIIPPDRYIRHRDPTAREKFRRDLLTGKVLAIEGKLLKPDGSTVDVDIRLFAVSNGSIEYVAAITPIKLISVAQSSVSEPTWNGNR